MVYGIYAFRDIKLGYMTPFYQANDQVAIRSAREAINDQRSGDLYRYKEDYEFWKIGTFDDRSGAIEADLKIMANCGDLIRFSERSEET